MQKTLLSAPACLFLLLLLGCASPGVGRYGQEALLAAQWLESQAVSKPSGLAWPADPKKPEGISVGLYSGVAGVVLFFLEAHAATGREEDLELARLGADYLLGRLPGREVGLDAGLYTGIAGIGFVLNETGRATGQEKYREGATRCLDLLGQTARAVDRGVEWNSTTDIVRGAAGTGLFLIYAAREMNRPDVLVLAEKVGRRLVEVGQKVGSGKKWFMSPDYRTLMPNFSHGTAGVCYFLATLHGATGKREYLDTALEGASYLLSVARDDDGCLVFHHEPEGKDLFYLGWCHGPPGTARLFYQLWQATGDQVWEQWMHRAARSVMRSGIPERRTAGFWNNVSICCGSAGVAQFFGNMYRVSGRGEYLEFSKRMTEDLLSRGERTEKGLSWVQAEHRRRPKLLVAQTGYMQGAAGIGSWLLHLDALENGRTALIYLPDSPFSPR